MESLKYLKLKPDVLQRVQAVLENPTEVTWNNSYSLIIYNGRTLWQLITKVDPEFPKTTKFNMDTMESEWIKIPTKANIKDALYYAIEQKLEL